MHSFTRHRPGKSSRGLPKITRGLVLNEGWRYDLKEWFFDTFLFRGKLRELRQRTADLAHIQSGEKVLDVGCGTGTLAILVALRVGATGKVFGIDPGAQQIASARFRASQSNLPIEFKVGVIEHLDFPARTFDVALSTLMMHHLSDKLKRQGLAELFRVLYPGGRLVIADFKRPEQRPTERGHFGPGGIRIQEFATLVKEVGFSEVEAEEMPLPRFSVHSVGFVGFIRGRKPTS